MMPRFKPAYAAALGLGLALALLATGCATPGSTQPGSDPAGGNGQANDAGPAVDLPGSAVPAPQQCSPAPPPQATVEPGTVLVRATRCVFDSERVPGDGEWMRRVDQEATTGLMALANALRLPSEQPGKGPNIACPAIAYLAIVLHLTDATGREFQPTIPHNQCGMPLPAVTQAIEALTWTTTATTRVSRQRTELEVTSGCAGGWKPVIALTASERGAGRGMSTVDTTGRELRVCRYELDADPNQSLEVDGNTYYVGKLASASTLDVNAAHELLTAVAQAPAVTGTCSPNQSPFAVVYAADRAGPMWTIETSGCYRADAGDGPLRQLDGALVNRLLG
jgi:hypothetical protein